MSPRPITEHTLRTARHTTHYLACGPADGTPVFLLHGWPELAISWRHQLRCLGDLGFRAMAPDMRGYGRSTVHPRIADYAVEHAVADMLELADHVGAARAIWIGHDWGTPVVWGIAAHHADRCLGVAGLCVPYQPEGFAPQTLVPLVDRTIYPEAEYPLGQWDYQLYYAEAFERANAVFAADPVAFVKAFFRGASPEHRGKPARLATVRRDGGHFGGRDRAPDLPLDTRVLDETELHQYASALARNGFAAPSSWYVNAEANRAYAKAAPNGGRLAMPVLFLHARWDFVCETVESRLADPMRAHCADLEEAVIDSAHWMAQEKPVETNAALVRWLARRIPDAWRVTPRP